MDDDRRDRDELGAWAATAESAGGPAGRNVQLRTDGVVYGDGLGNGGDGDGGTEGRSDVNV